MSSKDVRDAIENAEELDAPDDSGFDPNKDRSVQLGMIRTRTDDPCPVRALGMSSKGDGRIYLTPSGQLKILAPSKHNKQNITDLFETNTQWLWDAFPSFLKTALPEGEEPKRIGWSAPAATEWLLVESASKGQLDLERSLRGPGVWRSGHGGLIVHMGDRLWIGPSIIDTKPEDESRAASSIIRSGQIIDGYVYPAWPAEPWPAFSHAASVKDCEALLTLAECWTWKMPAECEDLGSILWLGWAAASTLSGSLTWRPHMRVIGDSGMGKTELMNLTEAIQGGERVISRVSDPTAAYVRQALGPASRPVSIDESEPDPKSDRASEVMKTIRMASSDKQAPIGRGGADGQPTLQFMRCCVLLTAVLPSPTLPQDRSRLTQLELGDLPNDANTAEVLQQIATATSNGARYRARMLLGWGRFQKNILLFGRALSKEKKTRRVVDQMGTILAAAATMISDAPADEGLIEDWVGRAMLYAERDPVKRDHEECLEHLLSSMVDPYRHGDRRTMGEWINQAKKPTDDDGAREMLPRFGMRVHPVNDRWEWLLVANNHKGLEQIFRSPEPTRWSGGTWKVALGRVPGALDGKVASTALGIAEAQKFAGSTQRYVAIPRSVFGVALDSTATKTASEEANEYATRFDATDNPASNATDPSIDPPGPP